MRTLKQSSRQYVSRPLNVILGAPSHIALLRALAPTPLGLTGREVARAAGIAQHAALDGLARLERTGIVRRSPVGRAYLFQLNRDHILLKEGLLPLLEKEGGIRQRLKSMLRRAFEGKVLSGSFYGSAARGEENPESDLDVCLIVPGEKSKEAVGDRAGRLFPKMADQWGVMLSPIVFTSAEFTKGYRKREPFFLNVVRDAEVFTGTDLSEVVGDQENAKRAGRPVQGRKLLRRRR